MNGQRGIAVVGGTGFIGGRLVSALQRQGRQVGVFGRASESVRDGWQAAPGIGDVDTVFYLACGVTPMTAQSNPELLDDELAMFQALLRAAGNSDTSTRVVLAASGGTVYPPTAAPPHRETDPVSPNNAYGALKLRMEEALFAQPGIEPVVVRLSNIYGPGQKPRNGLGVIAHWLDDLRRGQEPVLYGDPAATRDYLYIDDTVDLFVRIDSAERPAPILNAGSGVPTSLAELAGIVSEVTGDERVWEVRRQGRAPDRMHCHLCTDLARETLGWTAETALREGVRRTWLSLEPQTIPVFAADVPDAPHVHESGERIRQ